MDSARHSQAAAVSAGREDAAGDLARIYGEESVRLWRALFAHTASVDIATDAVSEAFAQALARGSALRDPRAWIWVASFKIADGLLKDRTRWIRGTQEDSYDMPESTHDLVTALTMLSPRQRLTVVLHDYADRPVAEIARHIGVSTATVYVHLSNARRRLRTLLEDDDG